MSESPKTSIGAVVIGHNEGKRLQRCLQSVITEVDTVAYVDSGSTDDSVSLTRELSVHVVELDMAQPFTAARARNAGFDLIQQMNPDTEFVFFIDGDCEMRSEWLDAARSILAVHPDIAIVAGRLRERHPELSVYNRLCDMEWDTLTGDVDEVGGIFVTRLSPFLDVGGFNNAIVAGEEPDLCFRLRQAGWRIHRVATEMAWHDAAMTHFLQWWKRSVRSGYGYAEGAAMRGHLPGRHWVRETRSNWFWGLGWPFVVIAGAWSTGGWSLLGFLMYPLIALRVARYRQRKFNDPPNLALVYGSFVMLGKLPFALGQLRYYLHRAAGRRASRIEHKALESTHLPVPSPLKNLKP